MDPCDVCVDNILDLLCEEHWKILNERSETFFADLEMLNKKSALLNIDCELFTEMDSLVQFATVVSPWTI